MKFRIRYGLSGGFGGCENMEWEEIEAEDLDEANQIAYQGACEEYEGMEGLHGLRTVDEIMEEDGEDEEEAEITYKDEKEGWLDYEVEEIK